MTNHEPESKDSDAVPDWDDEVPTEPEDEPREPEDAEAPAISAEELGR